MKINMLAFLGATVAILIVLCVGITASAAMITDTEPGSTTTEE